MDLREQYDDLVDDYQYAALQRHSHPFVSYIVLADLLLLGWRRHANQKAIADAASS